MRKLLIAREGDYSESHQVHQTSPNTYGTPPAKKLSLRSRTGVQTLSWVLRTLRAPCGIEAAHEWSLIFNAIRRMGTVGTVFHSCCLLEMITFRFLYRRVPIAARWPAGVV